MKEAILTALEDRYNAQISEADATLKIYLENSVGIGEHPQHIEEVDKQIEKIATAEEMGCDIVKLFPGGTYGPGFVKAIKGPQPWTEIMPTGGVSPTRENLEAWFGAGVTCVGMGSKLMAKHADGSFDYDKIESQTKNALDIIQSLK